MRPETSPKFSSEEEAQAWQVCLDNAARIFWAGVRESRKLTPQAQAVAAHYAGGPSVAELERQIILMRAE